MQEIGDNLGRLDQALFEGLTGRDASGFLLTGPRDEAETRTHFTEPMFRELASFLVEKYENVVIDGGRWLSDDLVAAALQSSTAVFLVLTQEFAAIRNAQRYVAGLMRIGFTQDQVKIVVNRVRKQPDPNIATIEQIKSTLNMPILASIPSSSVAPAAINKGRPFAGDKSDLDKSFRSFVDKAKIGRAHV